MLSKNKIKYINSLQNKKYRKEFQQFVVEGNKLIEEALISDFEIVTLIATEKWLSENQLDKNAFEIIEANNTEIKKISLLSTPQEVLAIVKTKNQEIDVNEINNKLSIVLDNIKDPGNLGTIIRLCDWFGIENLICSNETVDVYNSKTVQSTMGSIFRLKTFYTDLEDFLSTVTISENYNIYGAFLEGENIYNANLQKQGLVILGSESHGISTEIEEFVNKKITIPRFNNSKTESLNVAISAAIFCSEFMRR